MAAPPATLERHVREELRRLVREVVREELNGHASPTALVAAAATEAAEGAPKASGVVPARGKRLPR